MEILGRHCQVMHSWGANLYQQNRVRGSLRAVTHEIKIMRCLSVYLAWKSGMTMRLISQQMTHTSVSAVNRMIMYGKACTVEAIMRQRSNPDWIASRVEREWEKIDARGTMI